ncbi:hypothetical protein AV530_003279 [Patagioenas fasciata monilis]|uniref:Uncharacterized protein n=1 Tax=Patagioenas fasciata monilis TaxID=372326 RepID=A0A1V4K1Y1_PATFA|nr:hypothetical protein AV530_003279 [Patagioenas fasciata monilis]
MGIWARRLRGCSSRDSSAYPWKPDLPCHLAVTGTSINISNNWKIKGQQDALAELLCRALDPVLPVPQQELRETRVKMGLGLGLAGPRAGENSPGEQDPAQLWEDRARGAGRGLHSPSCEHLSTAC